MLFTKFQLNAIFEVNSHFVLVEANLQDGFIRQELSDRQECEWKCRCVIHIAENAYSSATNSV